MGLKKLTKTSLLTEYRNASADVWKWFKMNLEDINYERILRSGDDVVERWQGTKMENYVLEYVVTMTREFAKIEDWMNES